jgi:hypothetical protein
LEDCVFWYEASIHSAFTVGSKEFWAKHNELVADDDDDNVDELYDPSVYAQKKCKSGPVLNIKKSYR